jgi:hypothetical protein
MKHASDNDTRMNPKGKPLASGNGIDLNISLVEPVLFLRGFGQSHMSEQSTVVLRGSLRLRIMKPAKIKAVSLVFQGKAVTKWPGGDYSTLLCMHVC